MRKRPKILYVEDDLTLSFVTKDNLTLKGYNIDAIDNGTEALQKFGKNKYDLCILDIMLPKMDGFTLAEKIRENDLQVPIIFVTARSAKEDKIHGLELGGDDYITKPFSIEELVLKIEVFLKRRTVHLPDEGTAIREVNKLVTWDPVNLFLTVGDQKLTLTHREAELFSFLLKNREKVVKREELLIELWGHDHFFSSRSLDVFVSRLRKHLGNNGVVIENVYNVGYRLKIT
ncbi:MAG: response regulator transcription factor [Bacteroidia bacterium]|nr:response regulator transcription factor [Bacteroidia bacterium]